MRTLVTITLLGLLGCATPYVPSTHPGAASIRIENATSDVNLAGFTFKNPESCSEFVMLPYPAGQKTLPPGSEMLLQVDPSQRFALNLGTTRIQSGGSILTCTMTVTFKPEASQRYLLTFRWPND